VKCLEELVEGAAAPYGRHVSLREPMARSAAGNPGTAYVAGRRMDEFDPTAADYGDGQIPADELDQARTEAGLPDRHDRTGHVPIEHSDREPVERSRRQRQTGRS